MKSIGDRIQVLASDSLGTPEVMATIVVVYPDKYVVRCDDELDDPEAETEITHEGEVIYGPPV